MPDPFTENGRNKRRGRKQKRNTTRNDSKNYSSYPDLTDLDDPKWKTTKDEKFITYFQIINKVIEN